MIKKEIVIRNEAGLHARPAMLFVSAAKKFNSDIQVFKGDQVANAKNILSILALGVIKDEKIHIEIVGEDEVQAMQTLVALIENQFVE